MLKRFSSWITSIFLPFTAIAQELKILRELYELDLGSRHPPIYRITESPGRKDTEVFFSEEEIPMKGPLHKAMAEMMGIDMDDEFEEEDEEAAVEWPEV